MHLCLSFSENFSIWQMIIQEIYFHQLWYTVNEFLEMASHTKHIFHKEKKNRYIWCGEEWERINILKYILRYLYFWWCRSDLGCAWNKSDRGFDVKAIFGLAPRLLCAGAVIETQAFLLIGCSELHQNFWVTVHGRTCNLFSMIIRCIQRMKQAYVHVLIFTELSLYVKCSLGCFAF